MRAAEARLETVKVDKLTLKEGLSSLKFSNSVSPHML